MTCGNSGDIQAKVANTGRDSREERHRERHREREREKIQRETERGREKFPRVDRFAGELSGEQRNPRDSMD